jgi:hypothetical protein
MEEARLQSTEAALRKEFGGDDPMRAGLEAGAHSPWVSRLLTELGHEVAVANPRKIRAITSDSNPPIPTLPELTGSFSRRASLTILTEGNPSVG